MDPKVQAKQTEMKIKHFKFTEFTSSLCKLNKLCHSCHEPLLLFNTTDTEILIFPFTMYVPHIVATTI